MSRLKDLLAKLKAPTKLRAFLSKQRVRIVRHSILSIVSLIVALAVGVLMYSVYFNAQQQLINNDGYTKFLSLVSINHVEMARTSGPYAIGCIFGLFTFPIAFTALWLGDKAIKLIIRSKSN